VTALLKVSVEMEGKDSRHVRGACYVILTASAMLLMLCVVFVELLVIMLEPTITVVVIWPQLQE